MDGLEASRETAEKCLGDQFHMMLLSNLKHKTRTSLAVQWLRLHASTAAAAAKSLQSCPTLCDPIDGRPSGSTIPGILQARTLEWVAISFSNAGK